MLRCSRICHLQICHFDMWIVLSRRQFRPSRLRKSLFTSPWTAYKNYIEGLCQKVLEKEMATYLEKESLGEGNGNPFQYSCLENSMDRGDWWATVRGAAKSWSDWETNTVRESAITRDSFFIRKTYLHGIANICLPIIWSSHLLVNCLPPSLKPQTPTAFSLAWDGICASIARPDLSLGGDSVSVRGSTLTETTHSGQAPQ